MKPHRSCFSLVVKTSDSHHKVRWFKLHWHIASSRDDLISFPVITMISIEVEADITVEAAIIISFIRSFIHSFLLH